MSDQVGSMRVLCVSRSGGLAEVVRGAEAVSQIQLADGLDNALQFDVVVADLREFADELVEWLRERQGRRRPPVLLICTAATEDSRERALRAGAEDFLVAPVRGDELVTRLRRLLVDSPAARPTVRLSGGWVDLEGRTVRRSDGAVSRLSVNEAKLLAWLVRQEGRVVAKADLLRDVWGYAGRVRSRTVQVTIQRLRAKVEADPSNPVNVLTAYGEGYRVRLEDEPPSPGAPRALTVRSRPSTAGEPDPTAPTNLRRSTDAFVGRGDPLEALQSALAVHSVVTLTGPGGSGKTRLACELGWRALPDCAGGVWFVDLTTADGLAGVLHRVAVALKAAVPGEAADERMLARLGRVLRAGGPTLLILDNAESVAPGTSVAVESWGDVRDVRILVTSQRALGVQGEHRVGLGPLSAPDALALFLERMASATGASPPPPESLVDLVEHLDGLPLVIELAACRTRSVSPSALLRRLRRDVAVLRDPSGRRDPRHTSLSAMLEAVFESLTEGERRALSMASMFRGGFSLELAEAALVGSSDPVDLLLETLIDRALVAVSPISDGEYRYRLLQTVQVFAAGVLDASSDADLLRLRWAEGVYAWLAQVNPWPVLGGAGRRIPFLAREADNALHAFEWAARLSSPCASDLAERAAAVLHRSASVEVVIDVSTRGIAIARGEGGGEERVVRLLLRRALGFQWAGRMAESRADREEALRTAEPLGLPGLRGVCEIRLAISDRLGGQVGHAVHRLEAVLEALSCGEFEEETTLAMVELGIALRHLRRFDEALSWVTEAAGRSRRGGDLRLEMLALGSAAVVFRAMGRLQDAVDHHRAALMLARELGERRDEAIIQGNLGNVLAVQGHVDAAQVELAEALRVQRSLGGLRGEAFARVSLATVQCLRGVFDDALHQYLSAKQGFRAVKYPRGEGYVWMKIGQLRHGQGELTAARQAYEQARPLLDDGAAQVLMDQLGWMLIALSADEGELPDAEAALGEVAVGGQTHHATTELRQRAVRFLTAARVREETGCVAAIMRERAGLLKTANP